MLGAITLLYLLFVLTFVGGIFVIIYHLLAFRLNKSLAIFMVSLLVIGAVFLLGINILYFAKINWQDFFLNNNGLL